MNDGTPERNARIRTRERMHYLPAKIEKVVEEIESIALSGCFDGSEARPAPLPLEDASGKTDAELAEILDRCNAELQEGLPPYVRYSAALGKIDTPAAKSLAGKFDSMAELCLVRYESVKANRNAAAAELGKREAMRAEHEARRRELSESLPEAMDTLRQQVIEVKKDLEKMRGR